MVLTPPSREELSRALADANRSGAKVSAVNLSAIATLIEHQPADMTATVESGMTLAAFQARLRSAGQWLPLDPPVPEVVTISDLLAYDLSGPRRFGYGTVRDYLIGIRVALASGDLIHAGGKVVKNVAGYDLCKLFIGARNTLGIIVEGTFKLRPLPESEQILSARFDSIDALCSAGRSVLSSDIEPVILDAHNGTDSLTLVVGLAGATEDVQYQQARLESIARFSACNTDFSGSLPLENKKSVRPSEIAAELKALGDSRFVARLGNGIVYHDGPPGIRRLPNAALMKRVKETYDPAGVFPEYRL